MAISSKIMRGLIKKIRNYEVQYILCKNISSLQIVENEVVEYFNFD